MSSSSSYSSVPDNSCEIFKHFFDPNKKSDTTKIKDFEVICLIYNQFPCYPLARAVVLAMNPAFPEIPAEHLVESISSVHFSDTSDTRVYFENGDMGTIHFTNSAPATNSPLMYIPPPLPLIPPPFEPEPPGGKPFHLRSRKWSKPAFKIRGDAVKENVFEVDREFYSGEDLKDIEEVLTKPDRFNHLMRGIPYYLRDPESGGEGRKIKLESALDLLRGLKTLKGEFAMGKDSVFLDLTPGAGLLVMCARIFPRVKLSVGIEPSYDRYEQIIYMYSHVRTIRKFVDPPNGIFEWFRLLEYHPSIRYNVKFLNEKPSIFSKFDASHIYMNDHTEKPSWHEQVIPIINGSPFKVLVSSKNLDYLVKKGLKDVKQAGKQQVEMENEKKHTLYFYCRTK